MSTSLDEERDGVSARAIAHRALPLTGATPNRTRSMDVRIPADHRVFDATLSIPEAATGLIIFAHGSASSRFSSCNRALVAQLQGAGLATLLVDLLTADEEHRDQITAEYRFDIPRLTRRVVVAVEWAKSYADTRCLPVGLFGASTGAAAALVAAAELPRDVGAVVSSGGRPDLAAQVLPHVKAPTLLIVGGRDLHVLELNRQAMQRLTAPAQLEVVPGATHLFEEPGALQHVAEVSAQWFEQHLTPRNTNHVFQVPA